MAHKKVYDHPEAQVMALTKVEVLSASNPIFDDVPWESGTGNGGGVEQ